VVKAEQVEKPRPKLIYEDLGIPNYRGRQILKVVEDLVNNNDEAGAVIRTIMNTSWTETEKLMACFIAGRMIGEGEGRFQALLNITAFFKAIIAGEPVGVVARTPVEAIAKVLRMVMEQ